MFQGLSAGVIAAIIIVVLIVIILVVLLVLWINFKPKGTYLLNVCGKPKWTLVIIYKYL